MRSWCGGLLALSVGCTSNAAAPPAPTAPSVAMPMELRAQRLVDELVTIARMAVDLDQLERLASLGGLGIQAFQPQGEQQEIPGDLGLVHVSQVFVEEGALTRTGDVRVSRQDNQVVARRVRVTIRKGSTELGDAERIQQFGRHGHEFIKTTFHFAWKDEGFRYAVATSRKESQLWTHTGSLDRPSEVWFAIKVETQSDGSVVARGTETPMTVTAKVDANRQVTSIRLDPANLISGELKAPAEE